MPARKSTPVDARPSKKPEPVPDAAPSPAERITQRIAELADWRGAMLARLRRIIVCADPGITEEWKWNVPVWACGGILCTGETYKKVVKLTFAQGAALPDPRRLFNSSLDGRVRRAIDIAEDAEIDDVALTQLVQAAVRVRRTGGPGPA